MAVVNQKGGSGKTTTAVNLAAALGEKNRRVLVVDLDPQASASGWLGIHDAQRSLFDMFGANEELSDLVRHTNVKGVDLVPSSARLVRADKVRVGRAEPEKVLLHHMERLPAGRCDYGLVDCPPSLGVLTLNALVAVSEICVPVEAHVLPLCGLVQLLHTIKDLNGGAKLGPVVSGILACRVDRRTRHAQEVVEQLRDRFGALVYNVVIRENVRLAECPSFGQPITQYATGSAGAEDYRLLAEEVIRQERSS
jgi:chromosome partitioning protein